MHLTAYIPHGHCYLWQPFLLGLHGISDGLIAIAYFSIPVTLLYFVRQRRDLPYASVFVLFGAFIISCGVSHALEIWTLWYPIYWFTGVIKAITAIISVYTALALVPIVPAAIALPSPAQRELQAIITRNMAEGICLLRADNGIIVYANPKFEQMFGYGTGELDEKPVSIVNYGEQPQEVAVQLISTIIEKGEHTYEIHNVKKDGTPFWCEATTSIFEHPDYGPVLVAVQQDISDRKEAQEKLKSSLAEKELLLKEIYHRVKNNLQVIYSLLNLQSRSLADSTAQSVLRDSQSRIRAMALVHEQLYQSKDLAKIELADYAKSLAHSLLDTYRVTNPHVSIQLDIEAQQLNIETALPCGLILTELISNALKYAFPEGRSGKITVTSAASSEAQIMLMIQDDGIGLPSDFNLKTASSLGLRLVRNLAKQVKGEILILPETVGTKFQLSFPMQA